MLIGSCQIPVRIRSQIQIRFLVKKKKKKVGSQYDPTGPDPPTLLKLTIFSYPKQFLRFFKGIKITTTKNCCAKYFVIHLVLQYSTVFYPFSIQI
jgi:hypothetical protein